MGKWFKGLVIRVLRIPPQPQPPVGSAGSLRVFRAARNYYRYSLFRWSFKQVGALLGIVVILGIGIPTRVSFSGLDLIPLPEKIKEKLPKADPGDERSGDDEPGSLAESVLLYVEMVGLFFFVLQIPFTFMMVRLDYEMRWYMMTDRSLRIREGIGRIREMTMTFANVQNLRIEQGPIQRILGISDLRVRTAGGGSGDEDSDKEKGHGSAESMHIGYLRGVDGPEEIRDRILRHLRKLRDSGLGDPDDATHEADGVAPSGFDAHGETLAAARELLTQARALRSSLVTRT